jgi:hypothetical protein
MMKKLGIGLIISSFILAYFLHNFVFPFILSIIGFYLLFICHIGKATFEFTKLIRKYPNEAYDWFKQDSDCWKIYEGGLPSNYKNEIPSKRMRPLCLIVPKIGNRIVYYFGKFPECRESEKRFIENLNSKGLN